MGERRGPWVVLAALAAVMALAGTAIVAAADRAPGDDTGRGADVTLPATDGAGMTPPATDGADDATPGIARGGVDERPPPSVAVPALRTQAHRREAP